MFSKGSHNTLRFILISIAMLFIPVLVIGYMLYRRWLMYHTQRASAESHTINTQYGPVEYDIRGKGPVILHLHGGNVGHNGWFMLQNLLDAGLTILTPDRPGYLGTHLSTQNKSPTGQAQLMAALLDELNIEKVSLVGVSAGGPAAIQFAVLFPQRVHSLVLLSALTQKTTLTSDQLESTLGKLVLCQTDNVG